ncbi:hypothetical protein B0H14DRAFT_2564587 [Mycena olivaceomarginata]|nr:hypothetical protein B0H14DRAFT_2564587 [Mycena olivaceomarginata]
MFLVSFVDQRPHIVQLLVHRITYTNQYWLPATEEFRNQSYTDFACDHGLPSFAIDLTASILPGVEPFKKVIGIGHSAGSVALVFGAIAKADQSPFDGLILMGNLIIEPGTLLTIPGVMSARNDTPLRWGALDPDYTTMNNHSIFYPTSLSCMLIFDAFTKDVGTVTTFLGLSVSSLTANYTGPITKVVGSEDRGFCTGTDRCDNIAALTATERVLWPEAKSFQVIMAPGSRHCMNLDFLAKGLFNTFVNLVNQFAAL